MRFGWAVVLVVVAGTASLAQQAPPPVTLDVVVDGGESRALLSATDFIVSEGHQPLVVASARLVQPSSDPAPLPSVSSDEDEVAAASVADRIVGIYVDEYHLADDAGFLQARAAVAAFIRNELGPRDLVVVLKPLDSLVSIRMTPDREGAAQIVEGAAAREGDYTPRSTFEQDFIAGAPPRIDEARRQITLSALAALASHLGRLPAGRKTMVVLSNGIMGRTPSRTEPLLPGLESIARTANRAHVAIYALRPSRDPAEAAAHDAAQTMPGSEALATLAEQTAGFIIDGGGAAAAGLRRVQRDAGRYYLLTLGPVEGPGDGRLRGVAVRVRAPGATVRARAGYVLRLQDVAAPAARVSSFPSGLTVPRHMSPLVRVWFGQAAGAPGHTRVEFVWEPAPRVPGERGPVPVPARVSLSISALDGTPVFAGVATPSGRGASLGLSDPSRLSFETPPGALLVRMDVLDPAGRSLDQDVRDLVVGGFPGPLAFGTAAIYRARTPQDLRAIADAAGGAAPVASRQFSRTEHLVVRIPVVSRAGAPRVAVRLLSRFGRPMGDLVVTRPETLEDVAQVDVPLAALAAGGYALEFSARNRLGSALERLEFIVTP